MRTFALIYLLSACSHFCVAAPICSTLEKANLKLVVHTSNLKNLNTTKTFEGGPYKKRIVQCSDGHCQVTTKNDVRIQFDPNHPDSNLAGYVEYPNIAEATEWAGINSAISVIKNFAKKKLCRTSLSESGNTAVVNYGADSNIKKDVFNFDKDGDFVSWARKYNNKTGAK